MLYYEFNTGSAEYKLRLSTRATVALEKQLGCNPLMIFGADGGRIPTVTEMVQILHSSLQQYNHNIGMTEAYDIFDEWLADNHTVTDFLSVIVEVYKVSGIMKSEKVNEKN